MADLIPAHRPVPTREDRMRDASEQLGWTPGAATVNQPARTFAAYLDATERDQLDARAATAEAERDEALDDLTETRAKLAIVIGKRDERLTLAESSRLAKRYDEAIEARDVLRTQLDRTLTDLTDAGNEVDLLTAELARERHYLEAMTKAACDHRATAGLALSDLARVRAELGRALDALATIRDGQERIDRALAAYDTTPGESSPEHFACPDGTCWADCPGCQAAAALGSPADHAQDAPLTGAQLGEMSIRANVEQVEAIRHHARGYADAIAALRDDSRYMHWWSPTGLKPAGAVRRHLAAYLETVGPDGPDVTKPMPEREG